MADLFIADGYKSSLSVRQTERGIKFVKDFFQDNLSAHLNLQRVSAPLFTRKGTGINDDLNGTEHKATFRIPDADGCDAECLFSLAKWKRMVLAEYGFENGEGLYTDMNAIRPDEESLDNLHSVYVDQWDWERVITPEDRTIDFLKGIVEDIYTVLKKTEAAVCAKYPEIKPFLPDEITFLHSEDLLAKYPDIDSSQRENRAAKEYGAIFVIGIGAELADGTIHDGRAPDYDDWITSTDGGKRGLNGDIVLWNPLLDRAFEISSMGIRVDKDSLIEQLTARDAMDRKELRWHQMLLDDQMPLTIGGGIGQSRICMFFLRKLHIGEVQASIWPDDIMKKCKQAEIRLL